ncbi:MAG TPA: MBL fold metallo-hydrolase [Gammaproteobacteria bacterium]
MRGAARAIPAFVAACLAQSAPAAHAQTLKPAQPVRIERLEDSLYVISGEGGNVAAYVTDAGVVLVDDMFYRNYEDIVAAVASVTDRPIAWVLNTHQHDDHAGGNARMLAIAKVIAHEEVRANLVDIQQPYYEDTPGTPIGLPNVTFSRALTLHLGTTEVQAHHFGRGHTDGDAVIYFPDLGVVHTGDLFLARPASARAAGDRPRSVNIYVDYAQGGSLLAWADTLDAVLQLDFDTVIPGHGPVSTREDLVRFREDLATMRDRIAGLVRAGASKQQLLTVLEMDYGWRSTGCPPSPPTPGCLQFQQIDALIEELRR